VSYTPLQVSWESSFDNFWRVLQRGRNSQFLLQESITATLQGHFDQSEQTPTIVRLESVLSEDNNERTLLSGDHAVVHAFLNFDSGFLWWSDR
jgi:hypothetical protein